MRKAVFLDRDGVLNRERGEYTFRQEDFEVLPDVVTALKELVAEGYILIVVSNQGGIAKSLYSKADFLLLDDLLKTELKDSGVEIAETYFCPHHQDYGKCMCRKPKSLLFEKAVAKYDIDVSTSFCIGDKERDIFAAEAIGIQGVLIPANSSLLKAVNSHVL